MSALIIAAALTVSVLAGWPLVACVLSVAAKRDGAGAPSPWDARSGAADSSPKLLRGGLWIGLLERAAITGGIVLGHPGILAVVIAVKGLGRIPEIRDSSAAGEKFIIGTLASVGWAGLVGAVGLWLMGGQGPAVG